MHVLIVKTSSLGDIIHTLPALTDAAIACPNIQFDWIVEEAFQAIPTWHSRVNTVLPIALRRWRRNWLSHVREFKLCLTTLRQRSYDRIIDAQGLLKSALWTRLALGPRAGFSWNTAREPLASLCYQRRFAISKSQHAIQRNRALFAQSLGYALPDSFTDYGIQVDRLIPLDYPKPYYVFLHGTSWITKQWPEPYWIALANKINLLNPNHHILLPWGDSTEQSRAKRIQQATTHPQCISILPKLSLAEMGGVLVGAQGIVSADTGLGHLAAALGAPTVSLYGPTDPQKSGLLGERQISLAVNFPCAPCFGRTCRYSGEKSIDPPCFATLTPETVLHHLQQIC